VPTTACRLHLLPPLFVSTSSAMLSGVRCDQATCTARGWRAVLEDGDCTLQVHVKRLISGVTQAFANPEMYESLEAEGIGYTIRLPANHVLQDRIGYLISARLGDATRGAPILFELQHSGEKLETSPAVSWPRRVAPGEFIPALGVIRD